MNTTFLTRVACIVAFVGLFASCARFPKSRGTWTGLTVTQTLQGSTGNELMGTAVEIQGGPPLSPLMSSRVILVDKKGQLLTPNVPSNSVIQVTGVIKSATPFDPTTGQELRKVGKAGDLTVAMWLLETRKEKITVIQSAR